jgi:hypothetical protein
VQTSDRIDRRRLLTIIAGAAAVAAIGSRLGGSVAEAAMLPPGADPALGEEGLVDQAQVIIVDPRRGRGRRRRDWDRGRRCWWHRGRRICRW